MNLLDTPHDDGADLSSVNASPHDQPSGTGPKRRRGGPRVEPNKLVLSEDVAAKLTEQFHLDTYLSYFPQVTEKGRVYLAAAVNAPSRNPAGRRSNTTRYASHKTGSTLTAESDRAEMPAMLMVDHTPEVIYAAEQPPAFGIIYHTGLSTASPCVTPDLILFTRTGPEIVECKMIADVAKKCITQKGRYQYSENGTYRSDPASAATAELGIPFRILTESNYCGPFLKALQFLTPYYRSDLKRPITEEERATVLSAVRDTPGLVAAKVPIADAARRADVIYSLISRREIFAPLSKCDILALDRLRLFASRVHEEAYAFFCGTMTRQLEVATPVARQLPQGAIFRVARIEFTVVRHATGGLIARNGRTGSEDLISYTTLHRADVRLELREEDMATSDLIASLTEARLATFIRNYRLIRPYLPGGRRAGECPTHRTTRRLLSRYRKAACNPGGGERTLIPRVRHGLTAPRKSATSTDLLRRLIEKMYLRPTAPSAVSVYRRYLKLALRLNLLRTDIYSFRTVARWIADIESYLSELKRRGKRAALKFRCPAIFRSLLGAPNGFAPWSVGHMDHTLLDLLVWNPATGEFERPWVSALVDGYDGRILAAVCWFGSPNTKIVLELLRECLRRHGVLPTTIRVDWGAEFRSRAIQVMLASVGIHVSYRAKGEPRSGAPVETSFRGFNERVIHLLDGNVTIFQKAREATAAVEPLQFACWHLPEFLRLTEEYISANNKAPREFKPSPNDMFEAFVAVHGVHGASWLTPEIIDRLAQVPESNTRIVSQKATIRVRSVDYTAPALRELIGREVAVFGNRGDPRTVWFDDPRTRLRVSCQAATAEVLHANSAEEAKAVVTRRMDGSFARVKTAHEVWADFLDEALSLQAKQQEEQKLSQQTATTEAAIIESASSTDLTQLSPAVLITD